MMSKVKHKGFILLHLIVSLHNYYQQASCIIALGHPDRCHHHVDSEHRVSGPIFQAFHFFCLFTGSQLQGSEYTHTKFEAMFWSNLKFSLPLCKHVASLEGASETLLSTLETSKTELPSCSVHVVHMCVCVSTGIKSTAASSA